MRIFLCTFLCLSRITISSKRTVQFMSVVKVHNTVLNFKNGYFFLYLLLIQRNRNQLNIVIIFLRTSISKLEEHLLDIDILFLNGYHFIQLNDCPILFGKYFSVMPKFVLIKRSKHVVICMLNWKVNVTSVLNARHL